MIQFLEALELCILGGRWVSVGPKIDYADCVSRLCGLLHKTKEVRCEDDI